MWIHPLSQATFVCFVKPHSWWDISSDFGYNWYGVVYLNMVGRRYCVLCLTQSNTTWFSEVPSWRLHFVILTVSVSQHCECVSHLDIVVENPTKSQSPCQKAHPSTSIKIVSFSGWVITILIELCYNLKCILLLLLHIFYIESWICKAWH